MLGPVAVLVPAYNASSTIGRAVKSALAQEEASEVIVIDDGSTDETAQVASACDDGTGRLRVLRKSNGGPGSAVNKGRDASAAPYFCVLDSDDFFLPGRLSQIFAQAAKGWDMAADRLFLAQEGQENGPFAPWAGQIPQSGRITFEPFVRGNITDPRRPRTELGYLQPVFRRAFFDERKIRHDERLRLGEDYLFYGLALARGARFEVVETRRYVAVARPDSLSRNHGIADLEALRAADGALLEESTLTPAERRALAEHARHLQRKITYRRALETKAAGDLRGALRLCAEDFGTLLYIVDETARAKLRSARPIVRGAAERGNAIP